MKRMKTAVVTKKEMDAALKGGNGEILAPALARAMSANDKLIAVTVDVASPQNEQVKLFERIVLKDEDGKPEPREYGMFRTISDLAVATVPSVRGEDVSITRYYQPHPDMIASLGVMFDLPLAKTQELVLGSSRARLREGAPVGDTHPKKGHGR